MNKDQERHNVLFHNRAVDALNHLFQEFSASTIAIDRQKDVNVFQQQLGKYTALLKQQLDGIALEMLSTILSTTNTNEWNHSLSVFIQDYLREFRHKAKSL